MSSKVITRAGALLLLLLVLAVQYVLPLEAFDVIPHSLETKFPRAREPQKGVSELPELIERTDISYVILPPANLKNIRILGLTSQSVEKLASNYFVVVNNSSHTRMSAIYKENRIRGKSNFVTTDCIVHPYFAFTNSVVANMISRQLRSDLMQLLQAMLKISINDYKNADDNDIRSDIEHNIAYLSVALKILDPAFEIPRLGATVKLAELDLKAIFKAEPAHSAIFERQEDFSCYQPVGWCNSTSDLKGFFQCKEWLSRMSYAIEEVTYEGEKGGTNNFRCSVLLFRSLDLAEVNGKRALELWHKLFKTFLLLGCLLENGRTKVVYPSDYKIMLRDNPDNLKMTLDVLAEPFYRTKLLLAVRRQKPLSLSATSIFDLADREAAKTMPALFRLFPLTGEPEFLWFKTTAAPLYPSSHPDAPAWPVALLNMYVLGAQQAGNILSDNFFRLDPAIALALPELTKLIVKRTSSGQKQLVESLNWQVVSSYFRLPPENAQPVLRTELWMNRRLESAFAAWLDGVLAFCMPVDDTKKPLVEASTPSSPYGNMTPEKTVARNYISHSASPRFHYLDPNPELFRKLKEHASKLKDELLSLSYLGQSHQQSFLEFIRLFERLERIAGLELKELPVPAVDQQLLGNIDLILDKIDQPLANIISFSPCAPNKSSILSGFSLGLGYPGYLYIILKDPRTLGWTLARGAIFTYYEIPGLVTQERWQHGLDRGLVSPPFWTEGFDLIQKSDLVRQAPRKN